ncbi:MAG: glycosyltransferase [Chlamydiales bacterium]
MKIAVVHEWLVSFAGSERVLSHILEMYPEADLFSVIDFLPESERSRLLYKYAKTTFIQKLPFARSKYPLYLNLMPLAIEQLDLNGYDLVISSSHAVAKGVITHPGQLHICYCHSPLRYAWDLSPAYLSSLKGLKKWIARWLLHKMRNWDVSSSHHVDAFIANSGFIAQRIEKYYRRQAHVIYPGIDLSFFALCEEKEDFYITISRLVPYKKVDLIVRAFATMPDRRLIVIGDGPEAKRLKPTKNVELKGYLPFAEMVDLLQRARGFLFAAKEDFGYVAVEAQSCGTPVIAYGAGGALETVGPGCGLFFPEQSEESIRETIQAFEKERFSPQTCRKNAERFSVERFKREFKQFVEEKWHESIHTSGRQRDASLAYLS